jgi:hypothetical protein
MICFSIGALTLLLVGDPVLGADAKSKQKKVSHKKPTPAAEASPVDHRVGALSSCKKHVENMLKSPATQFDSDSSMSVVKADGESFDVTGAVHSANATGAPIGGHFNCHAQLIGGAVWSTKTSLDFAR